MKYESVPLGRYFSLTPGFKGRHLDRSAQSI